MALRLNTGQQDWRSLYDDLGRKVEELSQRVNHTNVRYPGTESRQDAEIRRDMRMAQDTCSKLVAETDMFKQEVTQLKEKNASMQKTIASLQRDLASAQADQFSLREDVDSLQSENIKLRAVISTLQKDSSKLRQQQASLTTNMEEVLCDVTSVHSDVTYGRQASRKVSRGNDQPLASASGGDLRQEVDSVERRLSQVMSTQNKDIEKLQQDVTSLRGKHGDAQADVSILQSQAQTWVNNLTAQITNLQRIVGRFIRLQVFTSAGLYICRSIHLQVFTSVGLYVCRSLRL